MVNAAGGVPPCVLHEDEHILVVGKPAGLNTHAPSPQAGEGLFEWLRDREPRWARLAIIHRLDKDTSGVMVFGLSPEANRSLTAQFAGRQVLKEYALATRHEVPFASRTIRTSISRAGDRYVAGEAGPEADLAETTFTVEAVRGGLTHLRARPLTGRTHQIRVHAASAGFPIHGDVLYGGEPAGRLWLHAERLEFCHPATATPMVFHAPVDFDSPAWWELRKALVDPRDTDAFRWIHGRADTSVIGSSSSEAKAIHVDQLGEFLLVQSAEAPAPEVMEALAGDANGRGLKGVYHKRLNRHVRRSGLEEASPRLVSGERAPDALVVRENGVSFEVRFGEGYSVGLFLDQRDNRRRFLVNHVSAAFGPPRPPRSPGTEPPTLLNLFAYTCGFSVVAALAGWRTTSLDLSRKYLDWGRRNFQLNGLDPEAHDFIFGDASEWLRRMARKGRRFDAVVLDPPTFSQSKQSGTFQVARDLGQMVSGALSLLNPGGLLLASSNAADWPLEAFEVCLQEALAHSGRRAMATHRAPQPPDFPIKRDEPGYLKTLWMRVD